MEGSEDAGINSDFLLFGLCDWMDGTDTHKTGKHKQKLCLRRNVNFSEADR